MDEESVMFAVEGGEGCEEDVLKWYYHGGSGRPKNSGELSLKAKRYLSSKGWIFWRAHKNGKEELRYQSPHGEVYNSLRMACKGYIDQGLGEGMIENLDSKQPKKRKCLSPENQPLAKCVQYESPKRRKTLNRQENRMIKSSKRMGESPVSSRNPRTVLSWLIDNNVVWMLENVYYRSKTGAPLMKGRITRDGIQCHCCSKVFTLTAFEDHAGSTNHRPAANIILDDGTGRSLSDCQRQVRDSMKVTTSTLSAHSSTVNSPKTVEEANSFQHENDEVCSACCGGGDLIGCEYCPSAFHMKCLGLKDVSNGSWFCPSCCCGICGIGYLRDKSFLTCHQCELKFHVDCLNSKKPSEMKIENNTVFLCSHTCEKIFYGLQKLSGKPILVGKNLTWTLLKSNPRAHGHGMKSSRENENQSKLRAALEVMHECFDLGKAVETGRDLVEDVIFSRVSKLKRLNFKGFYTAVLEENDDLVSVATLRVYDNWVAEMPLVATRHGHRRRGMCRVLVDELEKNLLKLGVEKLVLPSLPTTVETWTNNFGFYRMPDDEKANLLKYTLLDFQGTIICQKLLR